MNVNKVILMGRLGNDPEVRCMTNGEAVANVSLATSEHWKDKSGEKQEKTEWHNLVFYRRGAEILGEYCVKGQEIYVEGKLQTRKWRDKEGHDRYSTEIVISSMQMGRKPDETVGSGNRQESAHAGRTDQPQQATRQPAQPQAVKGSLDNFDDDIPF